MKYELIDLGRPKEKIWISAFIHTADGDLLIKGGSGKVLAHLRQMNKPYFGKLAYHQRNKSLKNVEVVAGNGLKILKKYIRKKTGQWERRINRVYYEIRSEKYDVLIKRVRRLPTTWLKEIILGFDDQVLVASDFLKDHGFELAAEVLMQAYHKANTKEYVYE